MVSVGLVNTFNDCKSVLSDLETASGPTPRQYYRDWRKSMKLYKPTNYNPDKTSIFIYVEPALQETETQDVTYELVWRDPKYANYWSNNWRKTHGYPLKRKQCNPKLVICVRPHLESEETTKELRETHTRIKEIFGNG